MIGDGDGCGGEMTQIREKRAESEQEDMRIGCKVSERMRGLDAK